MILNISINNFLLLFLWSILTNKISYTEELVLLIIYVALFIIISKNSTNAIRVMIVEKSFKLMLCYEQLIFLKTNIIIKNINFFKTLSQKKNMMYLVNIWNSEIKKIEQNYLDTKKEINNIQKTYYLSIFLYSKIYISDK